MSSRPDPGAWVWETARLRLRPGRPEDAAVLHQLWTERDPRVPAHRRIDAEGHPTVEEIADGLRADRRGPAPGLLSVERRAGGDLIGYCGLVPRGAETPDEPELAFELLRAVHGQGFATEAGRAVVDGADALGYPRLWASVWDWNTASLRVLEKLGFRDTGRIEGRSEHGASRLTVRER